MEPDPAPDVASVAMTPSTEPYFPYPADPFRRAGFIVGDIISAGVIVLIVTAVLRL